MQKSVTQSSLVVPSVPSNAQRARKNDNFMLLPSSRLVNSTTCLLHACSCMRTAKRLVS